MFQFLLKVRYLNKQLRKHKEGLYLIKQEGLDWCIDDCYVLGPCWFFIDKSRIENCETKKELRALAEAFAFEYQLGCSDSGK